MLFDLAKIIVIIQLEALKTQREVCTFLGNYKYYIKFIKIHINIIALLEKLLHKQGDFEWGKDQDKAFYELKERMKNA